MVKDDGADEAMTEAEILEQAFGIINALKRGEITAEETRRSFLDLHMRIEANQWRILEEMRTMAAHAPTAGARQLYSMVADWMDEELRNDKNAGHG